MTKPIDKASHFGGTERNSNLIIGKVESAEAKPKIMQRIIKSATEVYKSNFVDKSRVVPRNYSVFAYRSKRNFASMCEGGSFFILNLLFIKFMNSRDNIAKAFEAKIAEEQMYKLWENSGLFKPENFEAHLLKTGRNVNKPYVMTLPPPNANGDLHIGHTCGYSFQDAMGRFARLNNRPTLLLAGKDHAGIQTETVYSKKIAKEGRSKWELGREAFYNECYDFCINAADNARKQEKMIGLSADWSREKFTLDPNLVKVVYRTFYKMFNEGLVYRDKYIINQCPSCKTALADVDTVHKEFSGIFAYLIYPFVSEADNDLAEKILGIRGISVATTRPETMLGDTAVAVNPDDSRYKEFIGKKVLLPIANREIPVIADEAVDIETGMGALKVTPAHSPIDFEIAKTHKLEVRNVISNEGKMTGDIPQRFIGMGTTDCSKALCAELDELGLLTKIERIKHDVSVCERCETPIEPIISYQWFANMKPLADEAIKELKLGEKRKNSADAWDIANLDKLEGTKVIPSGKHIALEKFLQDIRPWCISRQLWWGQRIPVWYSGGKELFNWLEDQIELKFGTWNKNNISDSEKLKYREVMLVQYETLTGKKLLGSGNVFAQEDQPQEDENWKGNQSEILWEQEEDVFDTWFSSGQWNFTTLGGPEDLEKGIAAGADFLKYYPTDVMETMYDILFWWVARMMMLGKYMTGKTPFHTVYLHGMVMASDGQKMSKSKGNGVTPVEMINKYGADALRLWYFSDSLPGTNTPLREEKIKGNRNFVNKIWNASRFVLMNIEDSEINQISQEIDRLRKVSQNLMQTKNIKELENIYGQYSIEEIDKLAEDFENNGSQLLIENIAKISRNIREFRFNLGAEEIREFFWHVICDKWIENVKNLIADKEIGSEVRIKNLGLLMFIMQEYLKMMHPFIPFVTEAVWQEFVKLKLAQGILTGEELMSKVK